METTREQWTEEEFKTYLLLFCANSNYIEVAQDINTLGYTIGKKEFKIISREFDNDNDYQSIQKICTAIESQGYSRERLRTLFQEIKELFLSRGRFDNHRRTMFMGFKRILIPAA